jgi:vancomycin aglycone glucosyltransferase
MPAVAGARSVAEKLGIRSVHVSYGPIFPPSPHHPPHPLPGRPFPPEVTDNRVLNDLDVQSCNALFGVALNTHRASIGLPPVDNVRDHILTDQPWLAADPSPDRRPGRLLRRRRGQPAGAVRPGGRLRAPRWRGHHDDGRPGRRASGGGAPDGGPAILGRPGGRPGHRHGIRRSYPDHRILSAALRTALAPQTRARATAVTGTIRTDGTMVAATLLLEAVSRERRKVSA